jgi:hypothetical protein
MKAERRIDTRNRSFARILLVVAGRVGYVADVSEHGFKGLFPDPFEAVLGGVFSVTVSFEELGLPVFEIQAVVRWTKLSSGSLEVGFNLVEGSSTVEDIDKFEQIRKYYAIGNNPST